MCSFNKDYEACKEIGKYGLNTGKLWPIESALEEAQIFYSLYKDFKLAIINMFKDIKKSWLSK